MTYNEALEYIFSLKSVSLKPSLQRITAALDLLSNPQRDLKVIHIAGTNGKGSVASMIAEILKSDGNKTGLFISPFIIDFTERIQINGVYISHEDLSRLVEKVIPIQRKLKDSDLEMGQFEFITAVAFLYFMEQKCDYVVLETGLGGRFDATNIFDHPLCTVITKISLDHTAILGNTISKIAEEKAGIIKRGVPLVTCPQPDGAEKVIENTCKSLSSPCVIVNPSEVCNRKIDLTGTSFSYKDINYFVSLLGRHQIENALLAIEAVRITIPDISCSAIKSGLEKVSHPARLEVVRKNPPLIIDGAHNPDGALALAKFLSTVDFNGSIIFGGMKDKNLEEVAKILSPFADRIIAVNVENNPRSESAENLKNIFMQYNNNVSVADSYAEALSITANEPTVVCGSLYLAADVRRLFNKTI